MITVSKDNWTLKIEWLGYGLDGGVQSIMMKTLENGDQVNYPMQPLALVRDYNPSDTIQDESRDMPTEEEAKQWLDSYILKLQFKQDEICDVCEGCIIGAGACPQCGLVDDCYNGDCKCYPKN